MLFDDNFYSIVLLLVIFGLATIVFRLGRVLESRNADNETVAVAEPGQEEQELPVRVEEPQPVAVGAAPSPSDNPDAFILIQGDRFERDTDTGTVPVSPEPPQKFTEGDIADLLRAGISANRIIRWMGGNRNQRVAEINAIRDKYGLPRPVQNKKKGIA